MFVSGNESESKSSRAMSQNKGNYEVSRREDSLVVIFTGAVVDRGCSFLHLNSADDCLICTQIKFFFLKALKGEV